MGFGIALLFLSGIQVALDNWELELTVNNRAPRIIGLPRQFIDLISLVLVSFISNAMTMWMLSAWLTALDIRILFFALLFGSSLVYLAEETPLL